MFRSSKSVPSASVFCSMTKCKIISNQPRLKQCLQALKFAQHWDPRFPDFLYIRETRQIPFFLGYVVIQIMVLTYYKSQHQANYQNKIFLKIWWSN